MVSTRKGGRGRARLEREKARVRPPPSLRQSGKFTALQPKVRHRRLVGGSSIGGAPMILMRTATLSDGTIEAFAHSPDYRTRYWVTIDAKTGTLLGTNVTQDSDEFSRLLKAARGHPGHP